MSVKYNNPPIVEAVCEFQFVPSQPWDMTIPGLFYEKIRADFPLKQEKRGLNILGVQSEGVGMSQVPSRMQFIRDNKSALIQLIPDLLTVNHLKPYPTWEEFKPLILNNLKKYQEIAKPKGFKRIGLRYINIINFNEKSIPISEYFNFSPIVPSALPLAREDFDVQIKIPYENGQDHLRLDLATTIPEKPETLSLLLDMDYFMSKSEGISFEQTSDWLEKAHTIIEGAFEASITEKCRTLFK